MIYIRSLLFYVFFIVCTVVIAILVVSSRVFGQKAAWNTAKLWGLSSNLLLRVFCGVKIKVEGLEHIPEEACVVVANHQSTWETTTLPMYLPPFAWVLKKELMQIPIFGWALYAISAIAIQRSNPREALKQVNEKGTAALESGRSVLIFPEGTRMKVGEAGNYQPSAIMLAKKAGVALLPVAHNAGVCWPKGSVLKHPGTITLRFLPPISVEDVNEKKRSELLDACKTGIEEACKTLNV
ncbi:MAG: lysophospholipid acyltransferase family protein [Ghiorsea sp.]